MESNIIIAYLSGIIVLFIFAKIFIVPIKWLIKLIINSIFGLRNNLANQFHVCFNRLSYRFKHIYSTCCRNTWNTRGYGFGFNTVFVKKLSFKFEREYIYNILYLWNLKRQITLCLNKK